MSWLSRLFGGKKEENPERGPDGSIYIFVRCDYCQEVIRGRISPTSELSMEEGGMQAYYVRKVLVGQQCFKPIEVRLRYADRSGDNELSREATGGQFVDPREAQPTE